MTAGLDPAPERLRALGEQAPLGRAQHQRRTGRRQHIEVGRRADLGAEPGRELLQAVIEIAQRFALERVGHFGVDPFGVQREPDGAVQHQECGETPVFGVDLGQHLVTGEDGGDGAATAYQRQILIVARPGAAVSPDIAEAELRAFLDNPANRAELFAGRRFPAEPVIFAETAGGWR